MTQPRIWFETEPIIHDGKKIGDEFNIVTDFWNYHPFYMDQLELGCRVSDYINSPAEEQLLEDMTGWDWQRTKLEVEKAKFLRWLDEQNKRMEATIVHAPEDVAHLWNYDQRLDPISPYFDINSWGNK